MFLSFLKQVTWKSPHFIFHLYNNSAMLIPQWNFQNWIPKWRSCVTYYGCSFVAKLSKWLLYSKKINFRCLENDFFMFIKRFSYSMNDFYMVSKWFSLSENDFYMFNKWFLYLENDFTFIRKFRYSAVWILCLVTWDLYSTIWDLRLTK